MTTGISSSMHAALENSTATSKRKLKKELKKAGVYDKSMEPAIKTQAAKNRMQQVALTGELDLSNRIRNKLVSAGYTNTRGNIDIQELQKLVLKYSGSDYNVNYGKERNELIRAFNHNNNGIEFSQKDVLKIVDALGADFEKTSDYRNGVMKHV